MNRYRLFVWMVILAFLAGLINAVFVFSHDGMTVSHMTGLISKFAISVAQGDFRGSFDFLSVVLSFLTGAIVSGIATGKRAFRMERIYGWLILFLGVLAVFPLFLEIKYSTWLFAFMMGLQNGMVVTFRGILIRSTHMSGNLTDLGVYIGYKIRGNKEERTASGMVPLFTVIGFCLGGVVAVVLYKAIGNYVFVSVSAMYILLSVVYFFLQKTCIDKDFNGIPDRQETQEAVSED